MTPPAAAYASSDGAIALTVVKGAEQGLVVLVRRGHCVMIGRSPLAGESARRATGMLTEHSLQRLHIEDHALVERHLRDRAQAGARTHDAFASFDRDVDVMLTDDAVSACHAMIFVDEAGASLLDMGSTNGTFVNGAPTTSCDLGASDLVRVGETRLSVAADGAAR
jgi:hypothetical protein